MTTHVFIVNSQTLNVHLRYQFAGTGSMEKDEHFGLLADILRVRAGDNVIFYLETRGSDDIEGGFFGIFKVADVTPLVFHEAGDHTYLFDDLEKKLIYRTRTVPHEIYARGVPERYALDYLPLYSKEILWSLIYRKLKAKRGCTPLFPEESDRLISMIRDINKGSALLSNGNTGYGYDAVRELIHQAEPPLRYEGAITAPDPSPFNEVARRARSRTLAFEQHLQAYFTQFAGENSELNQITGDKSELLWLGNEVPCGVGMQKIDILTILRRPKSEAKEYRIIELKDRAGDIQPSVVEQVRRYIQWASEDFGKHLKDAHNWNIKPIIVGPDPNNVHIGQWSNFKSAAKVLTQESISLPFEYWGFSIAHDHLKFNRVLPDADN